MTLHITLPHINDEYIESVQDEIYNEGWEWFCCAKLNCLSPELEDAFENKISDADNKHWSMWYAIDVRQLIPAMTKSRFEDDGLWDKHIDSSNVEEYNQAISDAINDVEMALTENACDHFGIRKSWME